MSYPIIDLHEDIAYYLMFSGSLEAGVEDFDKDSPNRQSDLPKLLRANVKVVFASIFPIHTTYNPEVSERLSRGYGSGSFQAYTPALSKLTALEMIKVYYRLARKFSDKLTIIRSVDDVDRALQSDGKVSLLMAIEGADSLEDIYDLEIYRELGVRSVGITWNFDNRYGASCFTRKDYGLTDEGEDLVKLANELGVIIDLAHASKNTMIDVLKVSRKPVVISHANSMAINKHIRNVDDEVLELLHKNNGVIGITMIPSTIGSKANAEELAKHIIYIYEKFGPEIIAIGTDFLGIERTPDDIRNVAELNRLINILINKGFNEDAIRKITYENAYRVIKTNLS